MSLIPKIKEIDHVDSEIKSSIKFIKKCSRNFPSMCLFGSSGKGKSVLIYNLLLSFVYSNFNKKTKNPDSKKIKVYMVSETIVNNTDFAKFKRLLGKKFNDFRGYDNLDSFKEDFFADKNTEQSLNINNDTDEPTFIELKNLIDKEYFYVESKKKKKKKSDGKCSQNILIIDDMNTKELRKSLYNIMKQSRHHRLNVIVSTQATTDLGQSAINNLCFAVIFSGIPSLRMNRLYSIIHPDMEIGEFKKIVKGIKPYHFMMINMINKEYQINSIEDLF